ncbi:hypothetical protein BJ944DRAFT_264086 [Cunninghamella echinulata]|nr:hypothetical protein BJ944DRAFT_264086 [Cunninghamella echinulata]
MRHLPTWLFPYPEVYPRQRSRTLHASHSYIRKFCGCMSLRGGCTLACLIWIGINLYVSVLAFQNRSPVFSYMERVALIIQAVICLLFVLLAMFALFAVFVNMPGTLNFAHRSMWIMVIVFLVDFFVMLVLFGVNQPDFLNWCVNKSREAAKNEISQTMNTTDVQWSFDPYVQGSDLYNCNKLWQDEVKVGVIFFIMVAVCYVYWATCLWSYEQKILILFSSELQQGAIEDSSRMAKLNTMNGLMNIKPSKEIHPPYISDIQQQNLDEKLSSSNNDQLTLAQWTENALSSLMSKFSFRKS